MSVPSGIVTVAGFGGAALATSTGPVVGAAAAEVALFADGDVTTVRSTGALALDEDV